MTKTFLNQVKELKKKAEQNRQMHYNMCRRENFLSKTLHAVALVGSSATAVLTFAEYKTFVPWFPGVSDSGFKLIIGVSAGIVFILTILEEYFRFGEKATAHETVGKQLTSFIRRASIIEDQEVIIKDDIDKLSDEYIIIHENAPYIPDRIFLKEKRRLRVKIEVSKQLDKTPHMNVRAYRWKMLLKQFSGSSTRSENNDQD
ncbi:Uncharacterised protein [Actinobacillus pleuropneumoniae]|nr:Uncharacterised protein [Actinobacillus pleuropneumoniae]